MWHQWIRGGPRKVDKRSIHSPDDNEAQHSSSFSDGLSLINVDLLSQRAAVQENLCFQVPSMYEYSQKDTHSQHFSNSNKANLWFFLVLFIPCNDRGTAVLAGNCWNHKLVCALNKWCTEWNSAQQGEVAQVWVRKHVCYSNVLIEKRMTGKYYLQYVPNYINIYECLHCANRLCT